MAWRSSTRARRTTSRSSSSFWMACRPATSSSPALPGTNRLEPDCSRARASLNRGAGTTTTPRHETETYTAGDPGELKPQRKLGAPLSGRRLVASILDKLAAIVRGHNGALKQQAQQIAQL